MNTLLIVILTFLVTGCASNCTSHCVAGFGPGNGLFDAIAKHYDTMDDCQYVGKPEGYKLPGFCYANAGKRVQYIYDKNNKLIYTLK